MTHSTLEVVIVCLAAFFIAQEAKDCQVHVACVHKVGYAFCERAK